MLVILFSELFILCAQATHIQVVANTGIYEGRTNYSSNGTPYFSFRGIEYGKQKRFKEGKPVKKSTKLFKALEFGPPCIQIEDNTLRGKENCLYLNVYTCDPKKRTPVIVFIHGGAFMFGDGRINPNYFMDSCSIVYVTIQYRLGAFGFLDFNSPKYPSNLGMRDQLLAIKWIRANIAFFGGDPDKITLQGQSAGASSVHLHMLSPLTAGLFRAGISESGTGCAPWAVMGRHRARMILRRLMSFTYCGPAAVIVDDKGSAEAAAICLASLESRLLTRIAYLVSLDFKVISLPYGPVMEGKKPNAFVTTYPWNPSLIRQVPWLSGVNSFEGITIENLIPNYATLLLSVSGDAYLPDILGYRDTSSNPRKVTNAIKKFYRVKGIITQEEFKEFARKAISDAFFYYPNYLCQRNHAETPSYNYVFAKLLPYSRRKEGVGHTEELPFLFQNFSFHDTSTKLFSDIRNYSDADMIVSKTMVNLWTSFAINMIPSASGVYWESWNVKENRVLYISDNGSFAMSPGQNVKAIQFWDNLNFRDDVKN